MSGDACDAKVIDSDDVDANDESEAHEAGDVAGDMAEVSSASAKQNNALQSEFEISGHQFTSKCFF